MKTLDVMWQKGPLFNVVFCLSPVETLSCDVDVTET
jgi:hypothetical protein